MTLVGMPSPTQDITTVDGSKGTIGGKRDKPQVLFCYASWCGFCKKSLPWMESLHNKYKDKGVQVLALNLDQRGTAPSLAGRVERLSRVISGPSVSSRLTPCH